MSMSSQRDQEREGGGGYSYAGNKADHPTRLAGWLSRDRVRGKKYGVGANKAFERSVGEADDDDVDDEFGREPLGRSFTRAVAPRWMWYIRSRVVCPQVLRAPVNSGLIDPRYFPRTPRALFFF